ncbi:Pls/PosA family non-ribosomal peptide synthetase [Corynebacterium flavescens]
MSARSQSQDHPTLAVFGVDQFQEPRTLVDIFEETVSQYPDALALEGAGEALTYSQLSQKVLQQVRRLGELGVGHGDRIGIRVPSGTTDLYVAILSTMVAGAAYVPVDWDDPDSRADTVWEEAGVSAVYGRELEVTLRDKVQQGVGNAPARPSVADDAWIIFTSGSTGKPKGVAVTHRSAAALVDAESRMYLVQQPLAPGDRVMAGLSVGFDASCEEMWLAWRYGATLVAAPRDVVRSGDELGRWIVDKRITAVSTVPTLAAFWPVESLDNVRLLIFGGEACPLDLIVRLEAPGRELWNTYGPTEATIISTGQLLTREPPVRIGRPTPGWKLAVVGPDGAPVAWGDTGELIVGGVGLGRYLDEEKDAEVYAPLPELGWDRAYRTGDLVVADPVGLIFVGRSDDQVKFGGRRIELGELDKHLTAIPGVRVGAAAMHTTEAGSEVLVGYLVEEPDSAFDTQAARAYLAAHLPGGIVPTLCVLEDMPMKSSGKVDRNSLPWPLPSVVGVEGAELPEELRDLARLWQQQLGPLPLTAESDFFDLGGSSVAVAKLAVSLRATHPATNIGALYENSTLGQMARYLESLNEETNARPNPQPIPRWSGVVQAAAILAMYLINGLRYVVGSILVVWILAVFFDAGWVPRPPVLPLIIGWIVLFSLPGKAIQTVIVARLLTAGVVPGEYLRGSRTHLRIWIAERFMTFQKLEPLLGTPVTPLFFRMMGSRVGRRTDLHSLPPVTGLLVVGNDVAIEPEVDIAGHWIDGSTLHVGRIVVADEARIGVRSIVSPETTVGVGAEILPGSHVEGNVEGNILWGGSPLVRWGSAGEAWPDERAHLTQGLSRNSRISNAVLYSLGNLWASGLAIIALAPAIAIVLPQVIRMQRYEEVFPILAAWTPVFTVLTIATWISLVVLSIRCLAALIRPGYYSARSTTAWALWLSHVLLQKTLTSTYFIYASALTPAFLRAMGAHVGRDTEISTVETIPHLTWIGDRSFLADHSMCSAPRHRSGWVHVGTTVLGEGSFVGNSGIVGPDRDLPPNSLVAVLASSPYHPDEGTSWLGRSTRPIPRQKLHADESRTFRPSTGLRIGRVMVESLRLVPAIIAAWLDLLIVYVGTVIFMSAGGPQAGIRQVILYSGVIVFAAGLIAALIPVVVKWVIIGKFREGNRTLFSTFVWRSELADTFAEMLAVPSLIRMSLGTPMFNVWARLMGTRIGRNVWCETWWLPEFDLISIGEGATVNRGTVLQTHLFHDRVMSLEPVAMGAGSTLGPNSFMLPGSVLGSRSTIRPGSLVLRQDQIPSDSVWAGNPVAHIPQWVPAQEAGPTPTSKQVVQR